LFWLLPEKLLGQIILQDSFVRVTGYINLVDNQLIVQINNLSDSVIIVNGKKISVGTDTVVYKDDYGKYWRADLSLLESQPPSIYLPIGPGSVLHFKRILPKRNYTAMAYDFRFPSDNDSFSKSFRLKTTIEYLIVPRDVYMTNYQSYYNFKNELKSKNVCFKSYTVFAEILQNEKKCRLILQAQ
jgi:hypothetical protein